MFSNFLNSLGDIWYVPVGIILLVAGGIFAYVNTPKGKYDFAYFKYKMPVFGALIYAIEFTASWNKGTLHALLHSERNETI